MVKFDDKQLKAVIEAYKKYFPTKIGDEIYKWKAVKCFQDNWDINAEGFPEMLKKAMALTANLLSSRNHFPMRMIIEYAQMEPKTVREMFRNLYDNSLGLGERMDAFIASAQSLNTKHNPDKMHYQDYNSITTYLWLMYPDKYYIYKYSEIKKAVAILNADFSVKKGANSEIVVKAFELADCLAAAVNADPNIRPMLNAVLTADCYKDQNLHNIVIDLIFYMSRYYRQPQTTSHKAGSSKVWIYSPGENACFWPECKEKGTMCLGWDEIGDLSQYESREDMRSQMKEEYGSDKSYKNDSLATWEFVNEVEVGDVIFAKKGRFFIIGRGVVTGEYQYDESRDEFCNVRTVKWDKVGEWETEEYTVMKTLTEITQYVDYVAKLNALVDGELVPEENCRYWWLCANPKVWSIAEWPIGEEQEYTLYNENDHKRRIFQNFLDAKAGDKVICYEANPTKQVTGLAIVSHEQDGKQIVFEKQETLTSPIDLATIKEMPELAEMEFLQNPNGSFFKLTKEEYEFLLDLIRESNVGQSTKDVYEPYTKEDFLKEVYMSGEDFDTLQLLLKTKKNVILQGAPGVGKTYSARRLAYAIMGCKDESRISLVQFHQNYSYEDFIMGYKPVGSSFELQRGLFYKFCISAANNPDKDYFFIIDEINRGNLSKIFGELLILIEKDYRGEKIALAYKDEKFFVPKNLFIIGMMNTADRSLAMIDYALRRRFSFFNMKPGFESDGFKAYAGKFGNAHFDALIDAVKNLNAKIASDDSLGEGFEIGHSYFCEQKEITDQWLKSVVKYEIVPMLQEYWFDNKNEVVDSEKKLLAALND